MFSGEEVLFSVCLSVSPLPCFRFGWLMRLIVACKQELGQERCDDSEQRSAAGFEKDLLLKEKFCLQRRL